MTEAKPSKQETRRGFFRKLTGWLLGLGFVAGSWPFIRSLFPNVLYEPPRIFKIGMPDYFQDGVTFLDKHRLFLFRHDNSFHAVEGICSHLGCTLKFSPFKEEVELTVRKIQYQSQGEFHCPCHGSRFRDEGTNFAGPAPRPLKWYQMELSPADGQLVVNMAQEVDRDFRLVV